MSPVEMDIRWNPKPFIEFITGYKNLFESVDDLKKNLQESLNDATNIEIKGTYVVPLTTTPLHEACIRCSNKMNINHCTSCSFNCRRFSSSKIGGIGIADGGIRTLNQVYE